MTTHTETSVGAAPAIEAAAFTPPAMLIHWFMIVPAPST